MSDAAPISNLQEAMDYVGSRFVFDVTSYPVLQKLNAEERTRFSIQHNLLHMNKQLGRIATHLEDVDHGGSGNPELLKEAVVKELVNVLCLAKTLGLTVTDLLAAIPKQMK